MKNIFGIDNPLFVFIGKAVDILLLSILWLVLSLPVVTIGAASTALYYTMIKNVRRERGMLLKEFFCSFKLNFKQSTIMTLVLIGYLFLAWICIPFARQFDTGTLIDDIYHVVSGGILLIPFGVVLPWLFPLLSRFNTNIPNLIKGAFYFGFREFLSTIILMIVLIMFCIIGYCMPFWIPILPGIYAYFSTFLVEKGMRKYMQAQNQTGTELTDNWQMES